MLSFQELRVTADNKCLIIDVSVDDLEYFKNVTIDSIYIDTLDTWIPDGPSNSAIKVYLPVVPLKHVRLELTKPIIDASANTMYFVYVKADVSKAPEYTLAPCTCSKENIMGTVVNDYLLYNTLMGSIKEAADNCGNYKNFIDAYLRLQAVDASIKAGNYPIAIKYWKEFFVGNKCTVYSKPCGCHGRI